MTDRRILRDPDGSARVRVRLDPALCDDLDRVLEAERQSIPEFMLDAAAFYLRHLESRSRTPRPRR